MKLAIRSSTAYSIDYIHTLESIVATLEQSRDESWEAVSNRVSTLVESSVTSLSGRLTELEHVGAIPEDYSSRA